MEWVAISFSNAGKWKVKVKTLSRIRLLETPGTAAYQAPPSMGFSRQEYWSGVPLPSPIKAVSRSCFYSLYSFQDLPVSSYCPSGILQIRDWGEDQASSCFHSTPSLELPWLTFCSASLQRHSCHVPLPFYHIKNTWKLHKEFHSHEWRRNPF